MFPAVFDGILSVTPSWEPVAWLAVVFFGLGIAWRWQGSIHIERYFSTAGWFALVALWVVMLPYFALEVRSPLQTAGVTLGIPLTVYAGLVRWRGREQLYLLGKVVFIAGMIYLPAETLEPVSRILIETVAAHTHALMEVVGYSPGLVEAPEQNYLSKFDFEGHTTYIVLACTGIGSISVFGGALLAVPGKLSRRVGGFALIAGIIYGLNLIRNTFVGIATPMDWFGMEPFLSITGLFGIAPYRASFFTAHTLLAQPASLVVLVALSLLAIRLVPGVLTIFDEVIFLATGDEVDLREELGPRILGSAAREDAD